MLVTATDRAVRVLEEMTARRSGTLTVTPKYLRRQYPGDDGMVLDVVDELGESLSVETELGCRFVLRGPDFDSSAEAQTCRSSVGPGRGQAPRPVVGQMPEARRGLRMR